MSTYITLVSEQAIPNVQYIKEFADKIHTYLFISTEWMESKRSAQHIIDACGLKEKQYEVLVVNPESLSDILNKLDSILKADIFKNTEGYIVNCTLGNKVMSIALYEYFRENKKAKLLYSPIGANSYKGLIDEKYGAVFNQKVTVEEYLKSYGIGVQKTSSTLFRDNNYNQKILNYYLDFNEIDFEILNTLRTGENQKYRSKGLDKITKIPDLDIFLNHVQFPQQNSDALTAKEVRYLTGGWFEEWTYFLMKDLLKLNEEEISLGLITVLNAENDLDVVFTLNNTLYIIECKTAMPDNYLQQSTLYKSGALVDKFGRNAKTFIFTLSNLRGKDGKLKKGVLDRANQQNVTVADREVLLNGLDEFLKRFIL
jgi:hypothetical protein